MSQGNVAQVSGEYSVEVSSGFIKWFQWGRESCVIVSVAM